MTPSYIHTHDTGTLAQRAQWAQNHMTSCRLCPRKCGVNRLSNKRGYCGAGAQAEVFSFDAHFGEESPLVGTHGSGTIFFSHCNLLCNFCQNEEISHGGQGQQVTSDQLAWIMLELQRMGCHNINWVSPSHMVAPILSALTLAVKQGLTIPIVYNTSAYDSVETLQKLDGIVDIYMPDFKFWDKQVAQATCHASDYRQIACEALREMHRQVGDLIIDKKGLAVRGLLVRHLVMPESMAGTQDVMAFIAQEISTNTYVNIMPQYHPCGSARHIPGLNRRITSEEYALALKSANDQGLTRLDTR